LRKAAFRRGKQVIFYSRIVMTSVSAFLSGVENGHASTAARNAATTAVNLPRGKQPSNIQWLCV
jgi:hypothetical protein